MKSIITEGIHMIRFDDEDDFGDDDEDSSDEGEE